MGHQITALVAPAPVDSAAAREFDLAVFEYAGFAVVGLDAAHCDYWTGELGLKDGEYVGDLIVLNCSVTHFFASHLGMSRYALINTNYFGGVGNQFAGTFERGKEVLPIVEGGINQALRNIGVRARSGMDEFDTIGLGRYRSFEQLFEKYWPD